MANKYDKVVNRYLNLFESPMAPVEEPEVKPATKPTPRPAPSKPVEPKRHPLMPTKPNIKPRPQAGKLSPSVQAYINSRK